MMRSMFAGVSGLRTHQVRMDVIGNNIANVNTYGYKASRATFQEMMSQTLSGASAPTENRGGTNPTQVGLGVQLGSVDVMHGQGNTESTGNVTDLAIEGDGFFVLSSGNRQFYTRAGMFGLDETVGADDAVNGNLVSVVNGMRVQGYAYNPATGRIDANGELQNIYINTADSIPPSATKSVTYSGNLDSRPSRDVLGEPQPETIIREVQAFDSRGNRIPVLVEFTQVLMDSGGNLGTFPDDLDNENYTIQWSFNVVEVGGTNTAATDRNGFIRFNSNGSYAGSYMEGDEDAIPSFTFAMGEGVDDLDISLDFTGLTGYAENSTATVRGRDGYPAGALQSYTVDQSGVITGSYSNGLTRALWQVGMATFPNSAGLTREGSTMFSESPNSGQAMFGTAGMGGFGSIAPSSLEMSNVDLSQEFTNMIITQRGFQANSRIITTSDEMLQEMVNLKR